MLDLHLPAADRAQRVLCALALCRVLGAPIYNSFGEWLDSSYSDPEQGLTCQQCRMPSPTIHIGQAITNVAPGMGGVERDSITIHAFPGAASQRLLENSVTMTATARYEEEQLTVQVGITDEQTGHHVPTDSPLRHLIMLVEARDEHGLGLPLVDGPTLPEWCGVGDPAEGYYAGLPGKAFAKVLQELWTEVTPSGAYWNQTRIVSDNRIAAMATDSSTYAFAKPSAGGATVEVTLLFRRAFIQLVDWKDWDVTDITMEHAILSLPAS